MRAAGNRDGIAVEVFEGGMAQPVVVVVVRGSGMSGGRGMEASRVSWRSEDRSRVFWGESRMQVGVAMEL